MASTCSITVSTPVTSPPARERTAPSWPPIAPAPQIRDRVSVKVQLSRFTPGAGEQRACLVHGDLPQREHLVIRALIQSAEVAVAEILSQRDRIECAHARQVH